MSNQDLANRLLRRRELGGKRPPLSRRQKLGYSLWACVLVAGIVLENVYPNNPLSWFFFGAILAACVREFAWLSAIRKLWPFTEEVTDWSKVESMARNDVCQKEDALDSK